MKKLVAPLFIFAISSLLFVSCEQRNWDKLHFSPVTICVMPDTISYNHDIVPILEGSCNISGSQGAGCHGSGGLGGDFTSYSTHNLISYTSQDSANDLYKAVTWSEPSTVPTMPQSASKLSQCDINKIIRWMDQGSLNN